MGQQPVVAMMSAILHSTSQQTEETVKHETEYGEAAQPLPVESGGAGDILLFYGNLFAVIVGGDSLNPGSVCTEKSFDSLGQGIAGVKLNGGKGGAKRKAKKISRLFGTWKNFLRPLTGDCYRATAPAGWPGLLFSPHPRRAVLQPANNAFTLLHAKVCKFLLTSSYCLPAVPAADSPLIIIRTNDTMQVITRGACPGSREAVVEYGKGWDGCGDL